MAATKTTHTFDPEAQPEGVDDKEWAQVIDLIPGPEVAEAYTNRILPGGLSDFEYFSSALRLRHNVLMVGPSGAGKTTAARAFASSLGVPYASVEFNGAMDPAAVIGGTHVDEDSGLPKWLWGEASLIAKHGGVLMLDEVNFAPPRFTAAFHGVLDARQTLYVADLGRRLKKNPNAVVFGAYNPRYIGTNLLNEAFTNRWAFTIDPWGYDDQVEAERIGQYTPTLLKRVREMRKDTDISADIGTNTMEEFIYIAHDLNVTAAIHLFLGKLNDEDRAIASRVLEAERDKIADELGADITN